MFSVLVFVPTPHHQMSFVDVYYPLCSFLDGSKNISACSIRVYYTTDKIGGCSNGLLYLYSVVEP